MPSKDYKDALNDLRLSSEFCAKMEKKLSESSFTDDEYEEVENHVEVVETKGFKKYIAAAAVIAVIGAVGSGGYLRIKNDFDSKEQYGIDSEIEEESEVNESYGKIFEFPFGSIDLEGLLFIYSAPNCTTEISATASAETADKLMNVLSQIDWESSTSIYDPLIVNDETSDINVGSMGMLGCDAINFTYYKDGRQITVYFYSSGDITAFLDSSRSTVLRYSMTSEQFGEIKHILFGDETIMPDFVGIRADFNGVRYSMKNKSGNVSEDQALLISSCLSSSFWYTDNESYECSDEDAITFAITFYLSDEDGDYKVDLYPSGIAFVSTIDSESGKSLQKTYHFSPYNYSDVEKILNGLQDNITCPVDLSCTGGTLIKYVNKSECTCYDIGKYELESWQKVLNAGSWHSELSTAMTQNLTKTTESIIIKNNNAMLYICDNGTVIYGDLKKSSFLPEVYSIDDFAPLTEEMKEMSSKMTPLTDDELVKMELNSSLNNNDKVDILSESLNNDWESTHMSDSAHDISSDAIREIFENTEWEKSEKFSMPDISSDEQVRSFGYFSVVITADDPNVKVYTINSHSATTSFVFTNQGLYSDSETSCVYRCKDPEKLVEQIEELISQKKHQN
ncbi:hypothetical protein [Ruminococcus flavefaciens]|uniref:hypothetical protein n=1 Tax=Ruminococcus flavefaciens TaxID=1265 RepID=UPI000465690F|nr:hypothetical protein [Ruminococcus flavefaciens]